MNINKILIFTFLKLRKSHIPSLLDFLLDREYKPMENNKKIQEENLKKILLHAFNNVPYYTKIFKKIQVIDEENNVHLEHFSNIPILTKSLIQENFEHLKSNDLSARHWYLNTSGGSTGIPTKFIQDDFSSDYEAASKYFFSMLAGKDVGFKEIKLVGSERDIMKGSIGTKAHLTNLLLNRYFLNSFKMSECEMAKYVDVINKKKPVIIEAYVQSIYELAKFIRINNLEVYSPKSILTSAGTLYPEYKQLIEDVFDTKVYNRYGSREAPAIACSCEKDEGLHLNIFNHYVEILNDNLEPCKSDEIGHIYITTLNNYSMPLIRYQIGDMGIPVENDKCSCGRGLPLIKNVVGRETDVFKTQDGRIIPAEFFIHFIGVVYNKDFISKFQVVQKEYNFVVIKLVLRDETKFNSYKKKIIDSIQMVMGLDCKVEFEFVDNINPSKSGKYLYTISEVA